MASNTARPIRRFMAGRVVAAMVFAGATLAGCSGSTPRQVHAADRTSPEVDLIRLSISNAYLIKSGRPVIVDAGGPTDTRALLAALHTEGVEPRAIALIILTHAHGDHGGGAAALRAATGANIVLGAADVPMAASGRDDVLKPTGLEAELVSRFIDRRFPPFRPDVQVTDRLDLRPYGLAGHVELTPGHTLGSLSVLLDDGQAFVGDILRGGYLGGAILPKVPHTHYFMADERENRRSLRHLLDAGVTTFYVGHGGPLTRADILRHAAELGLASGPPPDHSR